ncbi:branched-chain amino acid ABC transporter substrate-binding protein [Bradyrhizobium sp. CCGB12]|uniref:branched-chain amino acid ABC transporter substrate-binding protein n=1 Tax=Bradyrhizobium sp. CCGB12 TaxID=2949632 RepID=UPI0020B2ED8B|nr:branched-chain amino acid ABC transporter substrate-binding protein [Bradyrhizobium sp. CCGB12]MCP3387838.1 branched-chain amino acid ABC transporter substrate-binding protein [Bradyrhizobium sp. CCGB12]
MAGRFGVLQTAMVIVLAGATGGLARNAAADPLKVALIEVLSGPLAPTGKIYESITRYSIDKINAAGGFAQQPIELAVFDNAGSTSVASDRLKEAIAGGANLVIEGGGSAIAAQLSEDIRRHNLRSPDNPVLFLNVGAEASELTGAKCHFYSFRLISTATMRANALLSVMKEQGDLGEKIYSINQNYSLGQEMEAATEANASKLGFQIAGKTLHDMSRIQDFAPYVAKIKESGAQTVITSSWGSDLLLLLRASADAGLKANFGTTYLDGPGYLGSAGASADGAYIANTYNVEDDKSEFAVDYQKVTGRFPAYHVEPHVRTMFNYVMNAIKPLDKGKDTKIDVRAIATALEGGEYKGTFGNLTMRKEDHQLILPIVVSKVSKDVRYKIEGSPYGFRTVKVIPGEQAIYPVQKSCVMQRS